MLLLLALWNVGRLSDGIHNTWWLAEPVVGTAQGVDVGRVVVLMLAAAVLVSILHISEQGTQGKQTQ